MLRIGLLLGFAVAAAPAAAAPAVHVVVAEATEPSACAALEAVAAALDGDPRYWVERGRPAASGSIQVAVDGPDIVVAPPDPSPTARFPHPASPLAAAEAALHQAFGWRAPGGLPLAAWLAPTPAAWRQTCLDPPASDDAVDAVAGWAVTGPLLTRWAALRAAAGGPATARRAADEGPLTAIAAARTAATRLRAWRQLEERLDAGAIPPVWTSTVAGASARFVGGDHDALALFDDGRFLFLDPRTGERRGRADVGTAEPRLWRAGGAWVAVTGDGLRALGADGQTRWRVDDAGLFPEIAAADDAVCAASPEQVACFDAASGRPRWSRGLTEPALGGPVRAGRRLVLPVEGYLEVRALDDGRRLRRAEVRGEISAPLVANEGEVWVFVGSDGLQWFDPERGRFRRRFDDVPPLAGPPQPSPGGLFLSVQGRRQNPLWRAEPGGLGPWSIRAEAPVLPLPDFLGMSARSGRRFVGASPAGVPLFSTPLDAAPELGVAGEDWLALAADRRVWLLDGRSGALVATVAPVAPTRAEVLDLTWTSRGGAALAPQSPEASTGVLSGLPRPDDPRIEALRAAVLRGVVEAGLEAGDRKTACRKLADYARLRGAWAWSARLRCPDLAESAARAVLDLAPPGSAARAEATSILGDPAP